jgi:hypothetical protein
MIQVVRLPIIMILEWMLVWYLAVRLMNLPVIVSVSAHGIHMVDGVMTPPLRLRHQIRALAELYGIPTHSLV